MKKLFSYLSMALVLALGATACSNADVDTPVDELATGTQTISLKVAVPGASTYAYAPDDVVSYEDKNPDLHDVIIYFTDSDDDDDDTNNTVWRTVTVSSANMSEITAGASKLVRDIPLTATTYYAIGNIESSGSGAAGPVTNEAGSTVTITDGATTVATLKTLMFKIADQQDPVNHLHLFAKGTFTPVVGSITPVSIVLKPAVARMELSGIEHKVPTANFELTDIFINNTFKMISIDPGKYPYDTNAIKYAFDATVWSTGYDPNFHIHFTGKTGAAAYTPTNKWGFSVVPAQKKDSQGTYVGNMMYTVIDGVTDSFQFGAVPIIVFKLLYSGNTKYLVVTNYKNTTGGDIVPYFEAGKVYIISNVQFDASDLQDEPIPGGNSQTSVTATVSVQNWAPQNIDPVF
ncbi:MAG: hypothetical protein LBR26_10540 [Prevotella sp.]|jgi:hypothetical protein|nr:hypothetical protein [Prevotella sp.]